MRIDIVTVFPDMVSAALNHSIIKRAMERKLVTIHVINLRDFTFDRHKTTDDLPYGGGGGMVMKIEPIARALAYLKGLWIDETGDAASASKEQSSFEPTDTELKALEENRTVKSPRIVLTDPRGAQFTQQTAREWSREPHLILLCGHYEGVDDRVRQHLITDEISIGDYILTGGELPALVIVDALTRLQEGALGDEDAPDKDTFSGDLLEYPHYTRPRDYFEWRVPEMLLSGHHAEIERWRRWHQLRTTRERRPDLFERVLLTEKDRRLLQAGEPKPPDTKPEKVRRSDAISAEQTPTGCETSEE